MIDVNAVSREGGEQNSQYFKIGESSIDNSMIK
jgi:hypothetical protein